MEGMVMDVDRSWSGGGGYVIRRYVMDMDVGGG